MNSEITLQRIAEICKEYDDLLGQYPEHAFEGKHMFKFIAYRLENPNKDISRWEYDISFRIDKENYMMPEQFKEIFNY